MENQLLSQPWISAPPALRVFATLGAPRIDVRFVGGCVRDGLLGRPVHDIDIGTPEVPDVVIQRLNKAGIKAIPTGIKHGTITAVTDGTVFEITTLRRDSETDGRHAVIDYTGDWREDAARRDFTINAMSCRQDGMVFDYFEGRKDLDAGRVRFVGNAADRVREDFLRILRFYRFHAHYGRGRADMAARAACRKYARRISNLSAERIHHELIRLLEANNPGSSLSLANTDGIWQVVFGGPVDIRSTARLVHIEQRLDRTDPLRRLIALTVQLSDMNSVADHLKLANADRDRLISAVQCLSVFDPLATKERQRVLLYQHGGEAYIDAALVIWARTGRRITAKIKDILGRADKWQPPKLPVDGADLISKGLTTGPAIGASLKFIERWWVANDFQPGREEALAKLEEAITFVRSLQDASG